MFRRLELRRGIFGANADLIGDPTLNMICFMFIARGELRPVGVTSVCFAAGVPMTTALRYLARLEERGLVERSHDAEDRRRQILQLTAAGLSLVEEMLVRTEIVPGRTVT